LVVLVCAALLAVATANGPCSRVGGVLRHADGTFCRECVLTDGFYRNNLGQFCVGSCETISAAGKPIVRQDSITKEPCSPCKKDAAKAFFRDEAGKFCKQECLRDGWYVNDKTPSFRDALTGQYCKPAAEGTKAKPTLQQKANRQRFLQAQAEDPQNPAADVGHHSAGLNAGSCTLYGGMLRTPQGKFCANECILKDGFYRNKAGEFCIRPCANHKAMTGAACADCKVDPKDKTKFRTVDGRFCEQECLRDGWLRPGVPSFRDPVTGRFCKNKN